MATRSPNLIRRAAIVAAGASLLLTSLAGAASGHPDHEDNAPGKNVPVPETQAEQHFALIAALELNEMRAGLEPLGPTLCSSGQAAGYACDGVDLISFVPLSTLGGGDGNDLWGWTHEETGRDFAIMGRSTGVTFVEITNPTKPKVIGTLASHSFSSIWRDLKVYDSHVFIVSEATLSGLQVFDLRQLLTQQQIPHVFSATAHLATFSSAHNIAIDEESGYAYAVGTNTCSGGLHMIDVRNPTSPQDAGCYSGDGYTHDAQCVTYSGPDADYQGREICLASNEDTLTIVDVTNKQSPVQVARTGYAGVGYSHQGWLTPDHQFFIADDELDELNGAPKTKSYVWDVTDLSNPTVDFTFNGSTGAIDHNQYIHNARSYQANYKAGLRIIDIEDIATGSANEVAYFDTFPGGDGAQFDGAWSIYPFYRANVIAVSTIDRGLFILGYEGENGSAHVADLDNRSVAAFPKRWRAIATIEARDGNGAAIAGATITVRWSNGKVKTCVTGNDGRCNVKVLRYNKFSRISHRVIDIDSGSASYASWLNGDSDGLGNDPATNSNGFRDTVLRPSS